MALAVLLSCLLASLPVLVGMVIVRRAGVSLSAPRGSMLNEDLLYVRWDEGPLARAVIGVAAGTRTEFRHWSERRIGPAEDWTPPATELRRTSGDVIVWEELG